MRSSVAHTASRREATIVLGGRGRRALVIGCRAAAWPASRGRLLAACWVLLRGTCDAGGRTLVAPTRSTRPKSALRMVSMTASPSGKPDSHTCNAVKCERASPGSAAVSLRLSLVSDITKCAML